MKLILDKLVCLLLSFSACCCTERMEDIPQKGYAILITYDVKLDQLSNDRLSVRLIDFSRGNILIKSETATGATIMRLEMRDFENLSLERDVFFQDEMKKLRVKITTKHIRHEFTLRIIDTKGKWHLEKQ